MQMEGKNGRGLHGNKASVQEYIYFQFCYNMVYSMDFHI